VGGAIGEAVLAGSECAFEVLAKPKLCQAHKFEQHEFHGHDRTFEDDHPTTTDKASNVPTVCIAEGLVKIRSVISVPLPLPSYVRTKSPDRLLLSFAG
jgi:hypothetical protein